MRLIEIEKKKLNAYQTELLELVYKYVKFIKKRTPAFEQFVMRDPEYAYWYAHGVIRGRWPEAEPFIMRNPESAYWYAEYVIKGRWPEAESVIMQDPKYAAWYAYNVIKGRWPEAEPVILTSGWRNNYLEFLKSKGIEI